MLTIKMETNGVRLSDLNTERWVKEKITLYKDLEGESLTVSIANDLTLLAFCVFVREGKLHHDEVKILREGEEFFINTHGKIPHFYSDKDTYQDLLVRLL